MSSRRDDFRPTASLTNLQLRAVLLRAVREFFDQRGYFEVDTPLLSHETVIDAWLEPIVAGWRAEATRWNCEAPEPCYLQTSPEFAMKRLLASGATAIYQLAKVFRNGEVGRLHNPEFTMVEWYRVGDELADQMRVVEGLVCTTLEASRRELLRRQLPVPSRLADVLALRPFETLSYDDAFRRHLGLSGLTASVAELRALTQQRGLVPPRGLADDDRDGWLNWLLAECIEPRLGRARPVMLCDYPPTQAALARTVRRDHGELVAERFELYIDGIEFCNGYRELTDAAVLRRRNAEQLAVRKSAGLQPLPAGGRLLDAMDAGLPESCGVALGFDRLVLLALGANSLAEVIPFPFPRA